MNAVDTNVLIYVNDPRDPAKQRIASELVSNLVDGVLIWQVACEYLAASRKLAQIGFSQKQAFERVREMSEVWPLFVPKMEVLDKAENLLQRFSLSFWDATLVAACIQAGIQQIYTEDFSGYPNIDGVEIINPFQTA